MRTLAPACVVLAVAALAAPAQLITAWDTTTSTYDEIAAVSPGYPTGAPIGVAFPGIGATGPAGPLKGGVAMNQVTRNLYATDGMIIERRPYPFFPGPVMVPVAFPWTPPAGMGPLRGMSIDPLGAAGGLLWVTDGVFIAGVAPVPGTPVIVPPFPTLTPVLTAPLTGLDWDPHTGTLWAVDAGGGIYRYGPGGAFVAFGPPPPLLTPVPASGIALDRTAPMAGIYVSFPGAIVEYLSGATHPPGAAASPNGLTFNGRPANLFGASSCKPVGVTPVNLTANSPAWSGNPNFGLKLTGISPGTPLTLLLDIAPNALVPGGVPFAGGSLFIDPWFSPSALVLPAGTMPNSGSFFLPAPLTGPPGGPPVPPGIYFYLQFVAPECASAPFFTISNGLQVATCLP